MSDYDAYQAEKDEYEYKQREAERAEKHDKADWMARHRAALEGDQMSDGDKLKSIEVSMSLGKTLTRDQQWWLVRKVSEAHVLEAKAKLADRLIRWDGVNDPLTYPELLERYTSLTPASEEPR